MALFDSLGRSWAEAGPKLGRSWALWIIWHLSGGPMTSRQIQHNCEKVSPTVLNKRLKELTSSGLVARGNTGY